jgi:hypothetical protein
MKYVGFFYGLFTYHPHRDMEVEKEKNEWYG